MIRQRPVSLSANTVAEARLANQDKGFQRVGFATQEAALIVTKIHSAIMNGPADFVAVRGTLEPSMALNWTEWAVEKSEPALKPEGVALIKDLSAGDRPTDGVASRIQ
jgi:hypothetical protein